MRSGRAHGWLIADLINVHLGEMVADEWDLRQGAPQEYTTFCPQCCGPCGALQEYFNTGRGRAEADAYIRELPGDHRYGLGNWAWRLANGLIDWDMLTERMAAGWCPNHKEEEK